MKLFSLLSLIACCLPNILLAGIQLDISVISKRGIDEKLVLVSEVHSSEILISDEWARIDMIDGPTLFVRVNHEASSLIYGPSDLLKIEGLYSLRNGVARQRISPTDIVVKLGEERQVVIKPTTDQQLEIIFAPKMVP
ncbi:MAG: hypothetical protein A2X86_18090 [Bdellovibrionales bacterium GWA2_49_15]|nr:MAG: hypothetical protein A2X86_18090 [Bdellovibrionales bacterium GWA2_49_15]HAZ11635.1 hypothetical protein [Bdellovibrionales bacterium]